MQRPTSQCASPVAASDALRRAALLTSIQRPRTREQFALERALSRPGVPYGKHAPRWLGVLHHTLKAHWPTGETLRFKRLAQHVVALRPELGDYRFGPGMFAVSRLPWRRDPADWHGYVEEEPSAVFRSLVTHLVLLHPVPQWAIDSVLRRSEGTTGLLRHVAAGRSLRSIAGSALFPPPLTRRMCHHLMAAPASLGFVDAVRSAQIAGFGGAPSLLERIADTSIRDRIGRQDQEGRRSRILQWLCERDYDAAAELRELVEYLDAQEVDPTGRPFASLVREMDAWQAEQIARMNPVPNKPTYRQSGFGAGAWQIPDSGGVLHPWTIQELLTWSSLFWEGRKMRHCVATWASWVGRGERSVWSLRRSGRRVLTVGVQNGPAQIVEVRGRCNRHPTDAEGSILDRWGQDTGLGRA